LVGPSQSAKAKDALRAIQHNITKLRHLCVKDSVFDDPTVEIESVSSAVREDISQLQKDIEKLQRAEGGASSNAAGVLASLRSQLVQATQEMASVLTARQHRVLAQATHREHFSSSGTLSANDITREAAAPLLGGAPPMGAGGELRRRGGGSSAPEWMGAHRVAGLDDEEEDGGGECVLNMPSAAQMNEQMQLRRHGDKSRLAAAEGVEKMITELAGTFQQMAGLVSQHGEMMESIDSNIDTSAMYVDQSEATLSTFLTQLTTDRAMIVKVFGALLVFGLFFLIFLR